MPEEKTFAERRAAPRYALHLVGSGEVMYRRGPGTAEADIKPTGLKRFKIDVVNVSAGGLLLTFDAELSSGDVLKIYFVHPERREPLTLEGQLQWMRRNATNLLGKFCGGLAYKNTPLAVTDDLVGYASRQSPQALP